MSNKSKLEKQRKKYYKVIGNLLLKYRILC